MWSWRLVESLHPRCRWRRRVSSIKMASPTSLRRGIVAVHGSEENVMTWDELLSYCLAKPGAWKDEPWEDDVVVKVGGKIFAFLGADQEPGVGVKCGRDREAADEWLVRYPKDAHVMSYIGRYGWNALRLNGEISDDEIREAIDASYEQV